MTTPQYTGPGTRLNVPLPDAASRWAEAELADALPRDQAERWRRGDRVRVEEYLRAAPALAGCPEVLLDLIHNEYLLREELGDDPRPEEYVERFPQFRREL